uniref:Hexose transporter 1 n=1 Tax=Globisporangium ultimum (strain ATCC 200006 / CBS 805.95 / DAOM BR144) TaxID=431595 RepID=K3WHM3_GLOUD
MVFGASPSPTNNTPAADGSAYLKVESPVTADVQVDYVNAADETVSKPTWVLYVSVGLGFIHAFQNGWSTGQVNLKTYNNKHTCDARPVEPGTCVMFPGHTYSEWQYLVNAWIVGGMVGTLVSSYPADRLGRRRTLWLNGITMIVAGVVEMTADGIWQFIVGRFIAGIVSGFATGVTGGYIAEISPPHLRSTMGTCFHLALTTGILVVTLTFFFLDTHNGWRYSAAVQVVLGGAFMILAPMFMVESPGWLLAKGRHADAESEIARLYGKDNVAKALTWLQPARTNASSVFYSNKDLEDGKTNPDAEKQSFWAIFEPQYRRQLIIAVALCNFHQFSGINAVIFYSSSVFSTAGIKDPRIGTLIVNIVNMLPTFFFSLLARFLKTRTMLLAGAFTMCVCAIVMTFTLVYGVNWASIIFTAIYVGVFGVSFGPLVWSVTAELFPVTVRASAVSLCMAVMWISKLIVGIGYPHLNDWIGNYSFLPFVGYLVFAFTFMWFMVPETTNKTIDEIQQEFKALREKKK